LTTIAADLRGDLDIVFIADVAPIEVFGVRAGIPAGGLSQAAGVPPSFCPSA
jgi:hypothetical protein